MVTMQLLSGKPPKWSDIHPTNGPAYKYETVAQACSMLETCYPDQVREARLGGDPVVRISTSECYLYPSREPVDRDKYKLVPAGWAPRLA